MIAILKQNAPDADVQQLIARIERHGVAVHPTVGTQQTILGLVDRKSVV